jgi:hypothetical protein
MRPCEPAEARGVRLADPAHCHNHVSAALVAGGSRADRGGEKACPPLTV